MRVRIGVNFLVGDEVIVLSPAVPLANPIGTRRPSSDRGPRNTFITFWVPSIEVCQSHSSVAGNRTIRIFHSNAAIMMGDVRCGREGNTFTRREALQPKKSTRLITRHVRTTVGTLSSQLLSLVFISTHRKLWPSQVCRPVRRMERACGSRAVQGVELSGGFPGTSEKHNGGRNVSFLIMKPRAWLRLANEQDRDDTWPIPGRELPDTVVGTFISVIAARKDVSHPRGGGARRQRHQSLITGERVYHYGSRNGRSKGEEERVLLNLASKVTLAFSFRSMRRHRMDIDLF
jgi:hypothetical protein